MFPVVLTNSGKPDFLPTLEAGADVSSFDWLADMQHDVPRGGARLHVASLRSRSPGW